MSKILFEKYLVSIMPHYFSIYYSTVMYYLKLCIIIFTYLNIEFIIIHFIYFNQFINSALFLFLYPSFNPWSMQQASTSV